MTSPTWHSQLPPVHVQSMELKTRPHSRRQIEQPGPEPIGVKHVGTVVDRQRSRTPLRDVCELVHVSRIPESTPLVAFMKNDSPLETLGPPSDIESPAIWKVPLRRVARERPRSDASPRFASTSRKCAVIECSLLDGVELLARPSHVISARNRNAARRDANDARLRTTGQRQEEPTQYQRSGEATHVAPWKPRRTPHAAERAE